MHSPATLRALIADAETSISQFFDARDFDSCGAIQNQIDQWKADLADYAESEDYEFQPVASFEPIERPYRELPDGPEGYGSYESRFENWYAKENE